MLRSRCFIQLRAYQRHLVHVRGVSSASSNIPERITIPCKNNGYITLEYVPKASTLHQGVILDQHGWRGRISRLLTLVLDASVYPPSQSTASSKNDDSPNKSILLYLPRGPIFDPQASNGSVIDNESSTVLNARIAAALADSSSATVMQVNYRVSRDHRFPTPIHDVLAGYDWAVRHSTSQSIQTSSNENPNQPVASEPVTERDDSPVQTQKPTPPISVGVCGELLGGTLAMSLALSECGLPVSGGNGHAGRVVAAAVHNPIVDWILQPSKPVPSTSTKRKSPRRKSDSSTLGEIDTARSSPKDPSASMESTDNPLTPAALTAARKTLFHPSRPADWFDRFASPILFLRTPGVEVPSAKTAPNATHFQELGTEIDVDDLVSPSYAELAADDTIDFPTPPSPHDDSPASTPTSTSPSTPTATSSSSPKPFRPRKLPLKYPPTSMLPVSFPSFRMSVTPGSELAAQGSEIISLLRRALGRFEFPGARGSGVKDSWDGSPATGDAQSDVERNEQDAYLQRKIAFEVRDGKGSGGWGVDEVEAVGRWFEEEFRRKEEKKKKKKT